MSYREGVVSPLERLYESCEAEYCITMYHTHVWSAVTALFQNKIQETFSPTGAQQQIDGNVGREIVKAKRKQVIVAMHGATVDGQTIPAASTESSSSASSSPSPSSATFGFIPLKVTRPISPPAMIFPLLIYPTIVSERSSVNGGHRVMAAATDSNISKQRTNTSTNKQQRKKSGQQVLMNDDGEDAHTKRNDENEEDDDSSEEEKEETTEEVDSIARDRGNGTKRVKRDVDQLSSAEPVWDTRVPGSPSDFSHSVLHQWFVDHVHDPYPSDLTKQLLARRCRLSYKQISGWFINCRLRKWKRIIAGMREGIYIQSINSNKKHEKFNANSKLQPLVVPIVNCDNNN